MIVAGWCGLAIAVCLRLGPFLRRNDPGEDGHAGDPLDAPDPLHDWSDDVPCECLTPAEIARRAERIWAAS